MICCTDLKDVPEKPHCCDSCHHDADEYGYDLCGDGDNWSVCCAVSVWLKSMGIDPCKPPCGSPALMLALEAVLNDAEQVPST